MREYGNFINGKWVPSKSGKVFENRNPSKPSEVISVHPLSTAEDVNEAVEAAKKAFKHWSRVPAPKRAEIIRKATEILAFKERGTRPPYNDGNGETHKGGEGGRSGGNRYGILCLR
jgi:hypothetical protein